MATPADVAITLAIASPRIHVAERQTANPLLQFVSNIKWEKSTHLVADFACGATLVLFISLKFHLLKPMYLERRVKVREQP